MNIKEMTDQNASPLPPVPIDSSVVDPVMLSPIDSGCAARICTNKRRDYIQRTFLYREACLRFLCLGPSFFFMVKKRVTFVIFCNFFQNASSTYNKTKTKAHIPLEFASALANFRVANAENDAQTT